MTPWAPKAAGRRRPLECPREQDAVALVLANGHDEDLRQHVEQCDACREAADVAALLREDGGALHRDVQVPAAGQIWWRAAIRARVEAVHAAEQPLTWLHGVACAIAAGLLAGGITLAWPSIERGARWLASADLMLAVQSSLPVAMTVGAFVILAPIAIYAAFARD